MESGNGSASGKGVLIPVSDSSDVFQSSILAPLQSAYLYEESKQSFRYKSAVLVKNPVLEEKYNAFRAKLRKVGYSNEDLQESYGFLLFDDISKAKSLGETGVLAGNSTCTTLGDPSKGVYISMYADCLDLNRWYHGKSGYIAIIRLTKGKVKKVLENYTQNFLEPTVGFDCHVSEQLPSVSDKTSSFLAFERTQYYVYELLDDGISRTSQSPSAACPFAIVSFSYTDTKSTLVVPQEKSEVKALVCHYLPWRGQLQIGTQFYSVGLRSTTGALIPVKLPPVVKVNQAFSMLDLRQLLPKAVFETRFSGEAFLDGFYCSLCELVPSEAEDTSSLTLLLQEIKEKDLVLVTPLNDGGFLILLHSCHFLTYDDTGSSAAEVLQGLFVFPDSRVVVRDIKFGYRNSSLSSEILRLLPVITYAEGEVEKTPIDPSEDLCEALMQHMQSYAALINPGLAISPSREVNCFPYQYDVPDAYKDLYSSPEWTNRAWQSIKTYLSKPASFQLPISKASEILAAGQEEQREDFDDCVYICLSSPETPTNSAGMGLEDRLSDQKSPETVETSVDSGISIAKAQVDLTAMSQNVVPDDLQAGHATKDSEKCSELSELNKSDDMGLDNLLTPPTSEDLPTELIVSITSAERSVTDETLSVAGTVSATKHNDFPLSGFSTIAKLQTGELTSLGTETDKTKRAADCPEVTNLTQTKLKKLQRGIAKGQKKLSKAFVEAPTSQTVKTSGEVDNLNSQKDAQAKASSDHQQLSNPSKVYWRKIKRRKRIFGKLSSKNKKVRSVAAVGVAIAKEIKSEHGKQNLETPVLMELEACPLRKKTERWDLKPVISECGRILVPHGSVDVGDQIKSLKEKFQSTKDEQCPENMLLHAHSNTLDTVAMEQESSSTPETTVDETEAKSSDDGTHPQNVVVSHVNPEQTILEHSGCNGSLPEPLLSSMAIESVPQSNGPSNDLHSVPSQAVQEKPSDVLSRGKGPTKCEFMLTKLKSIILRKKRKVDIIGQEETTDNTVQETEPCLKKGKVDSDTETFNKATVESTNAGVKEVSEMLSVDPLFAYALGLTPKVSTVNAQKTEDQNTQQKEESTEEEKQISLDKQLQIPQRPLSIFPRRGRIKTLKKHQGISADNVKKKWWLHFQTPACFARENLKYKDCTSDNSVRKTIKEKMNSACSSTDALNLLADLALSVNNDQVPPQPNPAVERKPETGLKKCDLTKGLSSAEQESVLHALLKQPTTRSNQPIESSSPRHLLGDSELVELVSKEHAYSLPPSSFLLLGLPGTPFQVPPLSGSTRLLHHHQTMYGDGIKTLHTSVSQGDRGEINDTTPEYPKKLKVRRRKFRYSRTFVNKEGSVQVTRQWQADYDFNFDSKFTSDAKEKTINRALHGPWDFSIQDTNEEVRLIIHMWIGLFYSRSTDRFIHVDSNFTFTCSEESGSLEMTRGMLSGQAKPELMANCFASFPNVMESSDPFFPKALDLSKKDHIVLDQVSQSVILDFSRKSKAKTVTSNPEVNRQETCVSREQKEPSERLNGLKSPPELQEASTSQCYREMAHSTEMSLMPDTRSIPENEKAGISSQKAAHLERTDAPSFKGDGITILSQEVQAESESVCPDLESDHAEPESVRAEQESIRTDPESVHTVKESLSAKLKGLCTELGSICTEPESIHAELQSVGADLESVGAKQESVRASPENVCSEQGSVYAEQESIHTDPESVHTAQESFSAKLEGLCAVSRSTCPEPESIHAELQSSSADLESVGAKQESVRASPESVCSEQGSVYAEQESIHTDPESVHTAQESFSAKLEDLCAKPGSICTELESIHTEMEIAGADLESVRAEPDSVYAELENICTDPKGVHSMQESFSVKLEGVNTEPESVGAELDSVCTMPKSISDLDTVCFKKENVSTKLESVSIEKASVSIAQESVFPEPESAEPESASVKRQGVCGVQESSCTVKEAVSTERDSVGTEPETNCSHLEGACVGKESICAEEEGVLPEPEGVQTEPEGVQTEPEGVCTLTETVSTERDNVGTQPESICSHLEGACVGQESIRAEEEGVLPEPEAVQTEPEGVCTLTETVSTERDNVDAQPENICSHLGSVYVGQESRCAEEEVVLPEPEGVQTEPEGVCTLTETVSTERDNVDAQPESICSHLGSVYVGQENRCAEEEVVLPEPEGVQTEPEGVCTLTETVSTEPDNVDAQPESICSHLGSVYVGQESRCAEEEGVLPEPDDVHPETEGVCKLTETVSTEWDSVGNESVSSRVESVYTGLEGVCAKPETIQTALEFVQVLHEFNKENRDVKDGTENYRDDDTTEMSLVPKDGMDLSKSVADKVDFKDIHTLPFKNKVDKVLGVEIQQKKAQPTTSQHNFERTDEQETSVGQDCHFNKWFSLTGCMQVIKPKTDQDRHKTTSQSNSNQRPVMAVKPSKSEELQADFIYRDLLTENFVELKPTKAPVVTNTSPTSILMEKTKEISKEIFVGRSDDKQKANELSSKRTWLPNLPHSKSNTDGAQVPLLDPSCQYQGWDTSKFNIIPSSSLSVLPSESTSCPKVFDKNQGFWADNVVEKTEQTTNSEQLTVEMDEEDWPHETTSIMGPKDNGIADDSHILEPQTSLVCTIFNTSRKRSYPFLEQLSRRCLQDDLTQASVEQECLIFSEQMKQLLKKNKRGASHLQDNKSNSRLSCASPLTIHFSALEEQEDSLDHCDMSLVGQKIKVDMSDRKDLSEETLLSQGPSQRTCNPLEHAGVSGVTTECARLYEAKMHDVCSFKKVASGSKGFRRDRSHPKTKTSNHVGLCDQMNREMEATFRNNLNTVVKKSCKTKYRFYMLVTSDDVFFDDTKAHLEAEGHTAVQPSDFFLSEDSSSTLLIILRNEDIAEHLCEIPHLLELKKSPSVKFVGIDEPDDVMNLTYQELFTRGGFIMFDRAVLESLSLCNMKKIYEILQDSSTMGKWKWMLHYRDSRRLKENARLSTEAKEKKRFLYWGQDTGILDVLPYHECDAMSRDEPDYRSCLVRLQVQNISSRYAIFITDTTTDGTFERNGILTVTLNTFLTTALNT